jgi:hypothetical protein
MVAMCLPTGWSSSSSFMHFNGLICFIISFAHEAPLPITIAINPKIILAMIIHQTFLGSPCTCKCTVTLAFLLNLLRWSKQRMTLAPVSAGGSQGKIRGSIYLTQGGEKGF